MQLQTASQVIRFSGELEDASAKFYEGVAQRYKEHQEMFLSLARDNQKNKLLIQRVYHEVISDALETGFSFEGLCADEYVLEVHVVEGKSLPGLVKKALNMEAKIGRFYLDAANLSKSFLADVPRAFERMAKRRDERKEKLQSLI